MKKAHPVGKVGECFLVGGLLYVWDVDDNKWKNVGNVKGPTIRVGNIPAPCNFSLILLFSIALSTILLFIFHLATLFYVLKIIVYIIFNYIFILLLRCYSSKDKINKTNSKQFISR